MVSNYNGIDPLHVMSFPVRNTAAAMTGDQQP